MQNNMLERDIAELSYMPMEHLKELWQSYYNTPAPHFNKVTLVNKLAYRMQELEYGGLKQEVINLLMDYGNGIKKKKQRRKALKPVVGTLLTHMYRVMRLTLLAPDIIEAVLNGTQPRTLTLQNVVRGFPVSWQEQRKVFGFTHE